MSGNRDANTATVALSLDQRRQRYIESGWWISIPLAIVSAHWLADGEQRLDGGYYAQEVAAAFRIIRDCGLEVKRLEHLTKTLWYPGRFKRIYAKTKKDGTPFLTASEMLQFRPTSEEFLANNTSAVELCHVSPNMMLVTRSGTVGRCVIVGKRLSEFAVTDDAIRVQVTGASIGYVYAFLSSWIGQTLVSKDQYGSAIKHLEPHHLAGVPVPLLPEGEQKAIHADIMRAYELRDEANQLLDEADELLHQELSLPRFDESQVPYLPRPARPVTNRPEMPPPKTFSANLSALNERLDASYHVPVARTAIELLHKGKYHPVYLRELADSIYIPPRFKRIYVQKEYGVPFLRPSNLPQMRPYDLGYLSRLTKVLDSLALHKGDVLITTDGTVGRIGIVTSRIAGWAGSNNIARITYGAQDFRNGFLAAFLSTPYGFYQLAREIYGGVIDHIEESQIESVYVPDPPEEIQKAIGERVVCAFEKKDEASTIEQAAIERVEIVLQRKSV
jgi:type I restriction enzyme, S subunit